MSLHSTQSTNLRKNDSRIRVVLVVFSANGGTFQYPALLANALAERLEITVFMPSAATPSEYLSGDVKTITYSKEGCYFPLTLLYILVLYVIRERPDVIHFPFYTWKVGVLPLILRLLGVSVVGTLHDPESHIDDIKKIRGHSFDVLARLRSLSSIGTARVIVHGNRTQDQALRLGIPERKIEIVPHGLYSQFAEEEQMPMSSPLPERYVLFFGTIRKNKGFDLIPDIISVANNLADEEVKGVVAGAPKKNEEWGNQLLDNLKEIQNLTVYDRYIQDGKVQTLFKNADAIVLPYRDATMSGVAMIAYTFEVPMVVTNVGDLGRTVKEDGTGIVVESLDPNDIGTAIADIFSEDDQRDLLVENLSNARSQYTWDQIATKTVAVYERAMSQ